jgi:hypothetical protein
METGIDTLSKQLNDLKKNPDDALIDCIEHSLRLGEKRVERNLSPRNGPSRVRVA